MAIDTEAEEIARLLSRIRNLEDAVLGIAKVLNQQDEFLTYQILKARCNIEQCSKKKSIKVKPKAQAVKGIEV